MSDREHRPDRRGAELVDFEHGGRKWTLTVGRFADGRVGEVFLDTPKASAIGEIAADAAIAVSAAFQHGAPLETVHHAHADRRAGPLGAALALIDAYQAQHKDSQQTGADADDPANPTREGDAMTYTPQAAAASIHHRMPLTSAADNPDNHYPTYISDNPERAVAVEVGGVVHLGHYSTRNGMIRVTYGSSCKATQLGGMENAPKGLARMILAEQVREALGHNEAED